MEISVEMRKIVFIAAIIFLATANDSVVCGQEPVKEHYTFATVLDGDTVPLYQLREVTV